MWALLCVALVACAGGPGSVGVREPTPEAQLYERPPTFAGIWLGEVAGVMGELTVRPLGDTRYYGKFTSDDGSINFVLNMRQATVARAEDDEPEPGNLVTFAWQDGQGEDACTVGGCGHGQGWVLINQEDTALSGTLGYGESSSSRGAISFVRVEDFE